MVYYPVGRVSWSWPLMITKLVSRIVFEVWSHHNEAIWFCVPNLKISNVWHTERTLPVNNALSLRRTRTFSAKQIVQQSCCRDHRVIRPNKVSDWGTEINFRPIAYAPAPGPQASDTHIMPDNNKQPYSRWSMHLVHRSGKLQTRGIIGNHRKSKNEKPFLIVISGCDILTPEVSVFSAPLLSGRNLTDIRSSLWQS